MLLYILCNKLQFCELKELYFFIKMGIVCEPALTSHSCHGSAHHAKKKQFVDELRKAVNPQNNKIALMEGGVTACVRMCKAFTYVKSTESSSVLLTLVKSVVLDLKVCVRSRCLRPMSCLLLVNTVF